MRVGHLVLVVDSNVPRSPGWWLHRMLLRVLEYKRQSRLTNLWDRMVGDPPLPDVAAGYREACQALLRKSRANFAELITSAVAERMVPIGIRTSSDGDETGDREAWRIWQRAGMAVTRADVHKLMLGLSEGYVIVGEVDPETGVPTITAEDPRQVWAETDPARPSRVIAAIKVCHNDIDNLDEAFLYLPADTISGQARVFVAVRDRALDAMLMGQTPADQRRQMAQLFTAGAWRWDDARGGADGQALNHPYVPVVPFVNEYMLGEFEPHLDLLDRITHTILQRMVITTLQAFRQRAVEGLPERYPAGHPNAGQEVDYTDVFSADPGALWQVPLGVKFWESGQVDLTPVLSSIKDDVQHLAVVTRTPFSMLSPEGANQSAEGATLQREGLVFKARDRIDRANLGWSRVMSLAFRVLGDERRADLNSLGLLWQSPELLSLTERSAAAAQASAAGMPWRSVMIHVMRLPPDDVDRMESERADDQALAQTFVQRQGVEVPSGVGARGAGSRRGRGSEPEVEPGPDGAEDEAEAA